MSLTLQTIDQLLKERIGEQLGLKDLPLPNELFGLERAATRIVDAIKRSEKIALVGDYDADGVISTALVSEFFDAIGYPLTVIIPNRFRDGYGINEQIISGLRNFDLIITVDNGIGAIGAAKVAKKIGIDLIITDHHLPAKQLPDAYAIVNPKQPACSFAYSDICGAQVAWYLIAALRKSLQPTLDMSHFLDLLTIAIVADMMPLLHINRALVKRGLTHLNRSMRPCIIAFKELYKKEHIDTSTIAFLLAPLINSAGRIDEATKALEFLRSQSIDEAKKHLTTLIALNEERKEVEQYITQEAIKRVDNTKACIVVTGEGWHEGVVGIVAARLARRFGKSAIVLTQTQEGILKGSGRSNGNEDLYAIVEKASEYAMGFGGHQAAIGLSLEPSQLNAFSDAVDEASADNRFKLVKKENAVLGELEFSLIDNKFIDLLERYAPFGMGNPTPLFFRSGVTVVASDTVGKTGQHYKLLLDDGTCTVEAIIFSCEKRIEQGMVVDIIYSVELNRFGGKERIQLIIDTIKSVLP